MTVDQFDVPSMAVIAARYKTTIAIFTHGGGAGPELILPGDPQRFFVRVEAAPVPNFNVFIIAGQSTLEANLGMNNNLPLERKYRDDPAGVTGEWFALSTGPGVIVISTARYLGD